MCENQFDDDDGQPAHPAPTVATEDEQPSKKQKTTKTETPFRSHRWFLLREYLHSGMDDGDRVASTAVPMALVELFEDYLQPSALELFLMHPDTSRLTIFKHMEGASEQYQITRIGFDLLREIFVGLENHSSLHPEDEWFPVVWNCDLKLPTNPLRVMIAAILDEVGARSSVESACLAQHGDNNPFGTRCVLLFHGFVEWMRERHKSAPYSMRSFIHRAGRELYSTTSIRVAGIASKEALAIEAKFTDSPFECPLNEQHTSRYYE